MATNSIFYRIASRNIHIKRDGYYVRDDSVTQLRGPPFLIKNHLPASFLPRKIWTVKPKIIYVARNPKDVAISFYHHYKNSYNYCGSLEDFLGLFLDGLIEFGPVCHHIMDFWSIRHETNILFLTYEEMTADLVGVIKKTIKFLNETATEDQIQELVKHLAINNMKKTANILDFPNGSNGSAKAKEFVQKFFRRGIVGSYESEMSEEYVNRFNEMIRAELNDCDLFG